MERISYYLIPWCDRPRIWDTVEEARTAAHELRKRNQGYFLYEVTKVDKRKQMRLMAGWHPGT